MNKNIIAYFIYDLLYWGMWLAFIYGLIVYFSASWPLWLFIIAGLCNTSYTSERVISTGDDKDEQSE